VVFWLLLGGDGGCRRSFRPGERCRPTRAAMPAALWRALFIAAREILLLGFVSRAAQNLPR
jgi:hypothetical protein